MSGTLKKISAPVLGTGYGKNIKNTFDDIDNNFGIIGNSDLYRGPSGMGVISVSIAMSDLMTTEEYFSFMYDEITYNVHSQRDSIITAIESLSEKAIDRNAFIDQLSSSTDKVMCCISQPENEESDLSILSIIPYVVLDNRFQHIAGDGSSLNNRTDMSCVLSVTEENTWSASQPFPTLYYKSPDPDNQNDPYAGMYWKVGESNTLINARGPKGQDGGTGMVYVCRVNEIPANSNTVVEIDKILDPVTGAFVDINNYTYEISDNSVAFVIVRDQNPVSPTGDEYYVYYISSLFKNNNDKWCANIGPNNAIYVNLGMNAFKNVMLNISTGNDYLKGLFVPLYSGGHEGFILFADNNSSSLNIVGVSNLDSNNLIADNKFSYSFKSDIKIYDNNLSSPTPVPYRFDSIDSNPMDHNIYNRLLIDASASDKSDEEIEGYYWKGELIDDSNSSYPQRIYIFSKTPFPTDGSLIYSNLTISESQYTNTYQTISNDNTYMYVEKAPNDNRLPNSLISFTVYDAIVKIGTNNSGDTTYLNRPINIVAGAVSVSNNLTIGGNTSIEEDLSVSGDATIEGGLKAGAGVSVYGDIDATGDMKIEGSSAIKKELNVGGTISANNIVLSNKNGHTILSPNLTVKDNGITMPTNVTIGAPSSSHIINGASTFKNKVTISTIENGCGNTNFVRFSPGSVFDLIGENGISGTIGGPQSASKIYEWRSRNIRKNTIFEKCTIGGAVGIKNTVRPLPDWEDIQEDPSDTQYYTSNPFTGMVNIKNNLHVCYEGDQYKISDTSINQPAGPMNLPVSYFNPVVYYDEFGTGRTQGSSSSDQTKYSASVAFDMGQIKLGELKYKGENTTTNVGLFGYDWENNKVKINMNVYQPIIDAVIKTGQIGNGYGKLAVNIDYYVIRFDDPSGNYSREWQTNNWDQAPIFAISDWVSNGNTSEYNQAEIRNKFIDGNKATLLYQHCSHTPDWWTIPAEKDEVDSYREITIYGAQPTSNVLISIDIPDDNDDTEFNKIRLQAVMIVTFRVLGGKKNAWSRLWGNDYCDVNKNINSIAIWDIRSSYNGNNDNFTLNKNSGTIIDHGKLNNSQTPGFVKGLYYNPDTIYTEPGEPGSIVPLGSISNGIRYKGDLNDNLTDLQTTLSTRFIQGVNLAPFITMSFYDNTKINAKSTRQRLYICPDGIILSGAKGQYFYLIQKPGTSEEDPNQPVIKISLGYTSEMGGHTGRVFYNWLSDESSQSIKYKDSSY